MKKIVQIVLALFLLMFTYHYAKEEKACPVLQEIVKADCTGKIKSALIGEVIILERSLYTTIEVEGWERISRIQSGMNFDLMTGELLLSVQIAGDDLWIEGDQKREYLENYFVNLIQGAADSKQYDTYFLLKMDVYGL